jgi:D-alanyl-D-alanine carboxypeptidase (penicillin-binding protein 5/6)
MMSRFLIGAIGAVLLLIIEIAILTPVLTYTSVGTRITQAIPVPPTATPVLSLKAQGTPPRLQAQAAYLIDADTGQALVNIQGTQRLPMASTTKIMTAILTIETANLNQIVTIKQDAIDEVKNNQGSTADLVVGDKIRLRDLLYGLMLPSGDDAAIAIADAVGGTSDNFVQMMNLFAKQHDLTQTHYINPDGLTYFNAQNQPDPNHYTTAADLVHLTSYALANPIFAQLVETQQYVLSSTSDHHKYVWDTTDTLLSTYPGATGVKTGFTDEAGYCLVFAATNGAHHLIGALLHEPDDNQRFVDASALLDWGFALPSAPLT